MPSLRLPQSKLWTPDQDIWNHRLYCGLTQSGKTLSMLYSLKKRYERERAYCQQYGIEPPYTRVSVIDPKGSLWGGYDTVVDLDGKSCVVWVDESDAETVQAAYNKIAFFAGEVLPKRRKERMARRRRKEPYNPRPHIIIIEEWIYLLDICEDFDLEHGLRGKSSLRGRLIRKVKSLVRTGLEDGVQVWLSSQEPTVEANQFSNSFRSNFDYYCFGSPVRGYESIEIAIDGRYNIVRSTEARKKLATGLNKLRAEKAWTTFAISGDPAKSRSSGPTLGRTPWIDPILKEQQFVFGPLDADAGVPEVQPERQVLGRTSGQASASAAAVSQSGDPELLTNLLNFPVAPVPVSRGAQRLLDYTRGQGGVLPRLQQAYNRLGSRWNTAEIVRQLANECVAAGLATLIENPSYSGSYRFELLNEDCAPAR